MLQYFKWIGIVGVFWRFKSVLVLNGWFTDILKKLMVKFWSNRGDERRNRGALRCIQRQTPYNHKKITQNCNKSQGTRRKNDDKTIQPTEQTQETNSTQGKRTRFRWKKQKHKKDMKKLRFELDLGFGVVVFNLCSVSTYYQSFLYWLVLVSSLWSIF